MYLALSTQIKQLDNLASSQYNMPVSLLMDNAGKSIFEAIKEDIDASCFAIFCGKGNNGGDGLKLAKYLKNDGKDVIVYLTNDPGEFGDIVFKAYNEVLNLGIEVKNYTDDVPCNYVIVDALLGVSTKGAPYGNIKSAIDKINSLNLTIISIDLPSGLNIDTGKISGSVVCADYTYTLALDKVGLNVYPGKEYAGIKRVLDIGICDDCVNQLKFKNYLTDITMAKTLLPKRKQDTHKYNFGRVGIVGGSLGMSGSVCMAANAALRCGAGLVYVFVPDEIFNIVSTKLTEAIILKESELSNYFDKLDVISVGMGYCHDIKKKHIIKQITQKFLKPVIFDAGSIEYLSLNSELIKNKKCSAILTPHAKEFSRLIKMDTEEINLNRMFLTNKYSKEYNSVILLKGAATITCAIDGELRINATGNSGMATAGSGDVLSGIIAALVAQGMTNFDAASIGAYIHGLAGDILKEEKTEFGIIATDLIEYIPLAFKKIIE